MRPDGKRLKTLFALSRHIRGFHRYLVTAILCNLLYKLLPIIAGIVTSYMVGSVLFGEAMQTRALLVVSGVLVVLLALFSYLDVFVSHDMAYRILAKLRNACYRQLDRLAPAALQGERSGDLINIVLNDVEQLEWFYAHTIGQIIVAVLIPTATLIFIGRFSWILPAVLVPFIGLMLLLPRRLAGEADSQGAAVKEAAGTLNAVTVDGVQGMKDIISFRWQKAYRKRFLGADRAYGEATMAYALRRANENRGLTLLVGLASLAATLATIVLVQRGDIPAVWFVPLLILYGGVFVPIMEALNMSTNYGLILGAAKRVLSLMHAQPQVCDTGSLKGLEDEAHAEVCFHGVSFAYPHGAEEAENPAVLRRASFSFSTGETVALVGASGSGKTTVARLLQRFWDVQEGSITINGTDIRTLTLSTLRRLVTVVPQEVYLFNISVAENMRLACLSASREDIARACRDAQADSFIERLPHGYDTVIGERGLRLSGGEKQRLSIARAILKDAPIIILDEASANLDAQNERLINQAIGSLKHGRATLVIAHRISTIRSADRIVVIKDGNVHAQGSYEELMRTCPYFSTLIGEQYMQGADQHGQG